MWNEYLCILSYSTHILYDQHQNDESYYSSTVLISIIVRNGWPLLFSSLIHRPTASTVGQPTNNYSTRSFRDGWGWLVAIVRKRAVLYTIYFEGPRPIRC